MDRATRVEEKRAKREKQPINPDDIERLAEKYMARMPYKRKAAAITPLSSISQIFRDWAGSKPRTHRF
jgi:hypothetical protein